jgi:NAD-dependent deacetylase
MKTIIPEKYEDYLFEAAARFTTAACAVALTGAGVSVNSGIDDFRSPGGLWSKLSPDEYATLEVFIRSPAKAWILYREMGKGLLDKQPNKAHKVLADFERNGLLKGLVTQNVDHLHQAAGSKNVLEIHGDHQHLHCLQCGDLIPVDRSLYTQEQVPACRYCNYPLKPNVVLFGEAVRNMDAIERLLADCDLLMVIGTSAQVYPAAGFPAMVKQRGGLVFEFNREPALATSPYRMASSISDYFFEGDLSATLPHFSRAVTDSM